MNADHPLLDSVRLFFRDAPRRDDHELRPDLRHAQGDHIREAAVLIPFHMLPDSDEPQILLTLRPTWLRSHAGQVSLPGGTREERDADARATALRECEEEIGTPADRIEVIGELGPVSLPSGYRITPVVGILPPDSRIRPCPIEVETVFHAPASLLLDPGRYRRYQMTWRDRPRDVLELQFGEFRIWGATAAILHGFGHALRKDRGRPAERPAR